MILRSIFKKNKSKKTTEPVPLGSSLYEMKVNSTITHVKTHHCFFVYSIQLSDTQETKSRKRKEFINDIRNYPEESWYLDDHDTSRHFVYENHTLRSIPFLLGMKAIDCDCIKRTANKLKDEGNLTKKYHYAYILKLLREEIIGKGFGKMTYEEFVDFISEVATVKKSNLQNQMPEGMFPNWKIKDDRGDLDLSKTNNAHTFAELFINTYKSLYAYYYGNPIPIDEKTEI